VLKEFRDFIARGNVLDLAVAVVIGAAFAKIVDSLVTDIIMPPLGFVLKGVDFSNFFITLGRGDFEKLKDAQAAGATTLNYGLFLNNVIGFLIVAFAIFLVIKQVKRFQRPVPVQASKEKECPFCRLSVPIMAVRCPHCTSELNASIAR
jgi:large conductance mechanosensitive channel